VVSVLDVFPEPTSADIPYMRCRYLHVFPNLFITNLRKTSNHPDLYNFMRLKASVLIVRFTIWIGRHDS
jgi:hypothetical protein